MSWLDGLKHRLHAVIRPGAYERELQDEMRLHLDLDAMQQRDGDRARRRFGNRTYYQEETRRMTWLASLDVLRQDFGYAWRSVRRSPAFTVMVVLTLALGLGVNAAVFSVLDRIYLRPPGGVARPSGLQRLWFQNGRPDGDGRITAYPAANYPMYRAIVEATGDAASLAIYDEDRALVMGQGRDRVRMRAVFASASYFNVLGVRAAFGRVYTAAEDSLGAGRQVVVLGDRFWRQELGQDSAILGRQLLIEKEPYTVVGVLPPEFTGLDLQSFDAWIPLAAIPARHWIVRSARGRDWWKGGNPWSFEIIRRAPDGGNAEAFVQRATMGAREGNRRAWGADADTLMRVITAPLVGKGPGELGQDMKVAARLGGVAAIVLLIACANVMNLLLARAVNRRREIAVRLALGISRWRLVRLLTTETVLLALIAGAAALLVGWWGGTLLRSQLFRSVVWHESALHWRVVAFAAGASVLAGLVAGIVPALQASQPQLTRELKEGARDGMSHRSRLRGALVVAQAALSVVLLVGAALFVRSLRNVEGLDIGYDVHRLAYGWANFEQGQAPTDAVLASTLEEIAERLRGRPGVEAVARAFNVPMQGFSMTTFFWGAGALDSSRSLRENQPTFSAVSPEFFRTTGLRIRAGSSFDDAPGARTIVVNERAAQLLWPAGDALGQCVRFEARDHPCYTVAGVVENARRSSVIEDGPKPQLYLPLDNMPVAGFEGYTLVVRTRDRSGVAALAEMRNALSRAFPTADVRVSSMYEILADEYWPWRLGARLFTAFGLLALLVAVIGIYSTITYGVTQRTHEFGVRVALGARVTDVLRQVVGEGLRIVAVGIAVGVALALASGKLVAAALFGVQANDPAVMLGVAAILLGVAAAAATVPALRASRVDPARALRAE
jgi:putative ABC transport system permease protein